ncbi:MAG TPA: PqqD family protein [Polyangia bacterium]|jgi:hypothetical protein
MHPAARVRSRPDVLLCPEEDEAFLFTPASGRVRLLNPTGLAVWRLIDGVRDVVAVTAAVCAEFPDAVPPAVAADVVAFLDELVAAELAEVVVDGG